MKLYLKLPGRGLDHLQTRPVYRVGGVPKGTNPNGVGHSLLEDLKALRIQLHTCEVRPARDVAARARELRDESTPNRIGNKPDDDRYRRRGLLGCERRWRSRGEDDVDLEADKVSRERGKPILPSLGVSNLNGDVLAIDPPCSRSPRRNASSSGVPGAADPNSR